jgi:MerR family transcriptional regulator, mercuric resistance operon regulatory protein
MAGRAELHPAVMSNGMMFSMQTYSIGQLAKLVGVPTSTVRFYERIGLIKPDFRTGGNYRGYTAATLDRLRFVRSAQATGLSLEDIEALLKLTHSTEPPCDEVLWLMRRRLDEIRQRIKDLRQVEKVLAKSLHQCCKGDGRDICREVCRLSGSHADVYKPSKRKLA